MYKIKLNLLQYSLQWWQTVKQQLVKVELQIVLYFCSVHSSNDENIIFRLYDVVKRLEKTNPIEKFGKTI